MQRTFEEKNLEHVQKKIAGPECETEAEILLSYQLRVQDKEYNEQDEAYQKTSPERDHENPLRPAQRPAHEIITRHHERERKSYSASKTDNAVFSIVAFRRVITDPEKTARYKNREKNKSQPETALNPRILQKNPL